MVLLFVLQQVPRLVTNLPRRIQAARRRRAQRHPLPYQRPRQQTPILGLTRTLHRFFCRLQRAMCHPRRIFNLFFQHRVLHHALQQAGAGHQNAVVLLQTQFHRVQRLGRCLLQVPRIQHQMTPVHAHRSRPAIVGVPRIDLRRLIQMRQGVRPLNLIPGPQIRFAPPLLRRIRVNRLAQLQRHQPFHQPQIGQRPRQIPVIRIPLAILFNRRREMSHRQFVPPVAPVHSPVARFHIAARDEVVALRQAVLGLLQQTDRVLRPALLEQNPCLSRQHRQRHRFAVRHRRQSPGFRKVSQRRIVPSAFPQAAR